MDTKLADMKAKLAALLFTAASIAAGVLTYTRVIAKFGHWQWILVAVAACAAVAVIGLIGIARCCAWKYPVAAARILNLTVLFTTISAALFVSICLWFGDWTRRQFADNEFLKSAVPPIVALAVIAGLIFWVFNRDKSPLASGNLTEWVFGIAFDSKLKPGSPAYEAAFEDFDGIGWGYNGRLERARILAARRRIDKL